jgi:glycosyltransferase involved in cell wall biosynthesis
MIGLGHQFETAGIASQTLEIADHLAASAATVTLLTALPRRPSWRRLHLAAPSLHRGDPPAESSPPRPVVVHLDHLGGAHREQNTVTRAAYEATRLASAATAALPSAPGLVVATTPGLSGVVAAARVARRHRAPLVVLVNDLLATCGGVSIAGAVEKHALASADAIMIMSEGFRAPIEGYGVAPERIRLLPTWTNGERSLLERTEARAALGWPTRGVLVLSTELDRGQDGDTVIEAARLLHHRRDVRFVVLGNRTPSRRLEQKRRRLHNVRFVDELDPARMADALAAADLLVLSEGPGASEAGSTALLASFFGAGRAVVAATARDGAAGCEAARSSGAAVVIPPQDSAELAETVGRLAGQPQLRTLMSQRAVQHAHNNLDYYAAMAVVDSVVDEALARPW